MADPTCLPPPPTIQAVIRSPLGEVRVWVEPGSEPHAPTGIRTSARIDYSDDADVVVLHDELVRVAAQLNSVIRRLAPQGGSRPTASLLGRWIADRAVVTAGARVPAGQLFDDYATWCAEQGLKAISQKAFGIALTDLGFLTAGLNGRGLKMRSGLTLRTMADVVSLRAAS